MDNRLSRSKVKSNHSYDQRAGDVDCVKLNVIQYHPFSSCLDYDIIFKLVRMSANHKIFQSILLDVYEIDNQSTTLFDIAMQTRL